MANYRCFQIKSMMQIKIIQIFLHDPDLCYELKCDVT